MNPELFVTLVIATGATEGVRAALMTVLGTTLGNALLIGAVAFGLSFVLASSALLFDVIRFAGVSSGSASAFGAMPAALAPRRPRAAACIPCAVF